MPHEDDVKLPGPFSGSSHRQGMTMDSGLKIRTEALRAAVKLVKSQKAPMGALDTVDVAKIFEQYLRDGG